MRLVAEHEAAHAVVAMHMGLPVEWVQVRPGRDEGIDLGAAVKIPDEEIDLDRDLFAVCVAMAAPSALGHPGVMGEYADLEASIAYSLAGRDDLDPDLVRQQAEALVGEHRDEINALAERLLDEGRVVFEGAKGRRPLLALVSTPPTSRDRMARSPASAVALPVERMKPLGEATLPKRERESGTRLLSFSCRPPSQLSASVFPNLEGWLLLR